MLDLSTRVTRIAQMRNQQYNQSFTGFLGGVPPSPLLEESPVGSSQSNGSVESVVSTSAACANYVLPYENEAKLIYQLIII